MKKTPRSIVAYKLVRVRKDGSLGPLFINTRQRIPMHRWLRAEAHRTKGYAYRPGWHCTKEPIAPHLSTKGRVWVRVLVRDAKTYERPESQGGTWLLAKKMRVINIYSCGGCGVMPMYTERGMCERCGWSRFPDDE